ncbi:hypothetical protein E2P81_ATG06257 [Venturia nashicola]|uniref:Uncharacterized protein n=1 Tax=Venturia nashicola TaxID=86259 RepID=A0A4Z1PA47_9PEZI|nr:hypothetical protein E6O75_ATG06402 [Venturia nashicola]TLD27911.1 hypothetical protein E2P81_ATG06257 [Venturia nashicola]
MQSQSYIPTSEQHQRRGLPLEHSTSATTNFDRRAEKQMTSPGNETAGQIDSDNRLTILFETCNLLISSALDVTVNSINPEYFADANME